MIQASILLVVVVVEGFLLSLLLILFLFLSYRIQYTEEPGFSHLVW